MPSRFKRTGLILTLAVLTLALTVIYLFPPDTHRIYGYCVFRKVTGWDCAGCGVLRGTDALLHGQFDRAFQLNALFVLSIPVLAIAGAMETGLINRHFSVSKRYREMTKWPWIVLIVIAWTLLRNLL